MDEGVSSAGIPSNIWDTAEAGNFPMKDDNFVISFSIKSIRAIVNFNEPCNTEFLFVSLSNILLYASAISLYENLPFCAGGLVTSGGLEISIIRRLPALPTPLG